MTEGVAFYEAFARAVISNHMEGSFSQRTARATEIIDALREAGLEFSHAPLKDVPAGFCQCCRTPITKTDGGRSTRKFCDAACRQSAHRAKQHSPQAAGGYAAAASLTDEQRKTRARNAANKRWNP